MERVALKSSARLRRGPLSREETYHVRGTLPCDVLFVRGDWLEGRELNVLGQWIQEAISYPARLLEKPPPRIAMVWGIGRDVDPFEVLQIFQPAGVVFVGVVPDQWRHHGLNALPLSLRIPVPDPARAATAVSNLVRFFGKVAERTGKTPARTK